jgi:hypothetical protein
MSTLHSNPREQIRPRDLRPGDMVLEPTPAWGFHLVTRIELDGRGSRAGYRYWIKGSTSWFWCRASGRLTVHRQSEASAAEHNDGHVICPRCGRLATGWPLKRTDVCSLPDAVVCIRQPETVLAAIARKAGRS